jgi:multiple sugar transport system substrate-binding protein
MKGEDNRVSRLSRRRLVQSAAAGAGAVAAGTALTSTSAAPGRAARRYGARRQDKTTLVVAFTSDDTQKIQPLLDDYAAANNVEFDVRQSQYDALYTELNLNLSGQTGAYDVISMDDPWIPQFAGGEFVMVLDDMLSSMGADTSDFVPELIALGDFPKGSGLRGIPWVGNVQVFAWRTDVLQELGLQTPATWDDVLSAAQAITEAKSAEGLYGFGLRGVPGNNATTSFLPVLRGYGTDIFPEGSWEPQLDSAEAMAAITTHLALAELTPEGVETVDHATNGRNMYSGLTAMSADIWPDLLLQIFDPELSKVVGKVEVGAEPAQEGVEPLNMTGNWLLGIPEGSQNAEAAMEFILWFTAPEQQKRLLLEQNIPATRISVLEDAEAVEQLPFLPGLLAAGRNAFPRPRTQYYPQVEQILGQYVAQAVAGQIDGEEALTKSNDEIRALMEREGELG